MMILGKYVKDVRQGSGKAELGGCWLELGMAEGSEQFKCAQREIRLLKVSYASFLAYGCKYSYWGRLRACMTVIQFSATC